MWDIKFHFHTKPQAKIQSTNLSCASPSGRAVYSWSLAGTAGSNPAGVMDACLFVLCAVKYRSLRLAHPSSRGSLSTVMCHCVRPKHLKNEAASACVGLMHQRGRKIWCLLLLLLLLTASGLSPGFRKQMILNRNARIIPVIMRMKFIFVSVVTDYFNLVSCFVQTLLNGASARFSCTPCILYE